MRKIRVAIVGVGNCASALIQGIAYYTKYPSASGLITPDMLGGYTPADIEVVCAFDVVDTKVGLPLAEAVWAFPNDTLDIIDGLTVDNKVRVYRGPTLDGLGRYLREIVNESIEVDIDVQEALEAHKVDVVVNYLPVGSDEAAKHYAGAALRARCAFVNCMPCFIASNPEWEQAFWDGGVPIIGDDIKSQFGATIVHRVLASLMRERGIKLTHTSQLNVGGNTDFLNMLERDRLTSKKISKTNAVTSVMGITLPTKDVHVGPSDHVPWLGDRKWAHIRLEGTGFASAPVSLELKLEVWDSPNSAGVVMDCIRVAAIAQDRGLTGPMYEACAVYMKSPPHQYDDDMARDMFHAWLGYNGGDEDDERDQAD
jgi:myo-inositol-1-phosphate synthase